MNPVDPNVREKTENHVGTKIGDGAQVGAPVVEVKKYNEILPVGELHSAGGDAKTYYFQDDPVETADFESHSQSNRGDTGVRMQPTIRRKKMLVAILLPVRTPGKLKHVDEETLVSVLHAPDLQLRHKMQFIVSVFATSPNAYFFTVCGRTSKPEILRIPGKKTN